MTNRLLSKLLLIAIFVILVAGCEPLVDVRVETIGSLQQIHEIALSLLDQEIAVFDQQLSDIEDKEAKLEQLTAQTQQWIEEQEKTDYEVPCG